MAGLPTRCKAHFSDHCGEGTTARFLTSLGRRRRGCGDRRSSRSLAIDSGSSLTVPRQSPHPVEGGASFSTWGQLQAQRIHHVGFAGIGHHRELRGAGGASKKDAERAFLRFFHLLEIHIGFTIETDKFHKDSSGIGPRWLGQFLGPRHPISPFKQGNLDLEGTYAITWIFKESNRMPEQLL